MHDHRTVLDPWFSRAAFDSLTAEGITRAWDGLGGSHTFVTYPPLDALRPLAPESVLRGLVDLEQFSLYVHLPFCEMSCPFCPYERNVLSTSDTGVDAYLNALAKEMDMIAGGLRNGSVHSLYVGGGTAAVLTELQLKTLFSQLKAHFNFSPDTFTCVETSPNALIKQPSKIELLRDLGVQRVSVGVQTLSEAALRSEGRTHAPDETLRLLETLTAAIEVVNVDLMQDMPEQTDDDLVNDMEQIARLPLTQVTWYVERLRKYHGAYPDSFRSVRRRLSLRDRMKDLSYQPRPGGRFIRSGNQDDTFKSIRCGLSSHLVGLGSSAYGHVPGSFYRNTVDTATYVRMVSEGKSPVATGTPLRKVDVFAAGLASGIRWGVELPQSDRELDGYISEAKRRLDILVRHDLVRFDRGTGQYQITLDGPGWAYEEEICSLFVPQDIVDQIRARSLPWWFSGHSGSQN